MKKIIGGLGRQSRMKNKDHKYSINSKHGEAFSAKERLFVCLKGNQSHANTDQAAKPFPMAAAANIHTSIPVEFCLDENAGLNTEAMNGGLPGDPQYTLILCRTGTNRNGYHFTAEELATRHMTVINKNTEAP